LPAIEVGIHASLIRVEAPENFSLINNPESAIRFLSQLHYEMEDRKFFVDLAKSATITCDAIAVLAATIESDLCRPHVSGNWPEQQSARQIISDSGFHRRVKVQQPEQQRDLGTIIRRDIYLETENKKVATERAKLLVEFARVRMGREGIETPSYGVLIDLMDNTFAHASRQSPGQVTWWATVYCDTVRNKECYSFVDLGVGIFRSKSFRQRISYLPDVVRGRPELRMKALLEGRVPSITGLPYRGKGLPWIRESALAGRIEALVVIANDVYAKPVRDEYRALPQEFHGTFVYWET
jgi:hypothetical protein